MAASQVHIYGSTRRGYFTRHRIDICLALLQLSGQKGPREIRGCGSFMVWIYKIPHGAVRVRQAGLDIPTASTVPMAIQIQSIFRRILGGKGQSCCLAGAKGKGVVSGTEQIILI